MTIQNHLSMDLIHAAERIEVENDGNTLRVYRKDFVLLTYRRRISSGFDIRVTVTAYKGGVETNIDYNRRADEEIIEFWRRAVEEMRDRESYAQDELRTEMIAWAYPEGS